jgi:hypothetical protein
MSNCRHLQQGTPADTDGRSLAGRVGRSADSAHRNLASGRRDRICRADCRIAPHLRSSGAAARRRTSHSEATDLPGSFSTPARMLRGAVFLALDCPAPGRRVQSACGVATRSAFRRPWTRHPLARGFGACENDREEPWSDQEAEGAIRHSGASIAFRRGHPIA